MAYKIYISTTSSAENIHNLAVIKQALYSISEFPVAAVDMRDMQQNGEERMQTARSLIDQSDLFIGLYAQDYGESAPGDMRSYAHSEYQYAHQRGKLCLFFVPAGAYEKAEVPQKELLDHLMRQHVINTFKDDADLQARVKLSIDNFRRNSRDLRDKLKAGISKVTQGAKEEIKERDPFEAQVNRAVQIASDDFEQIMRRALELHDAQRQVGQGGNSAGYTEDRRDGSVLAQPIWGEPLRRTQFQSDIFMIMPFRQRFDQVYNSAILPTTAGLNLSIKRGDDFTSIQGSIIQEVWAAIYSCRLVVAELSELNANVYYELGMAHTLGKPAILLTQTIEPEMIPFDIRHLRFLVYNESQEGLTKLQEDLRHTLVWLLNDLQEQAGQ